MPRKGRTKLLKRDFKGLSPQRLHQGRKFALFQSGKQKNGSWKTSETVPRSMSAKKILKKAATRGVVRIREE